jgi:uncharacterized protein involved in response to NO
MTRLIQPDEKGPQLNAPHDRGCGFAPRWRCALWNLGFRPFYLCAGIFSAFAIAWWVMQFTGGIQGGDYLRDSLWHAHEMIFGYAFAVVVGFLFTAVRSWSGRPTPRGRHLALIVALWLAARVLLVSGFSVAAAAADVAFAVAAAWGIAVPLYAGGNRRNLFFVPVLLAIGLANLAFHLAIAGWIDLPVRHMLQVALDLILFIMAVVGGRVIPMFTASAVPQAKPRKPKWLEYLALGSLLALLVTDVLCLPAPLVASCAAIAAIAHGARLALWQPWHTLRRPILWILHAAYAWIVVHLVLRTATYWDAGIVNIANHALTVGAIGGLTLGMMTRTARGHTGRPLAAGLAETTSYLLVQSAAVIRVLVPLCIPSLYLFAIKFSGVLWVAAFMLFSVTYAPILWRPRVDGKPG